MVIFGYSLDKLRSAYHMVPMVDGNFRTLLSMQQPSPPKSVYLDKTEAVDESAD